MSRESEEQRWAELKASENRIKSASKDTPKVWNPFPSIEVDPKHEELIKGIDSCVRSLQDINGKIERNNLDAVGYKINDLERSLNKLGEISDDVRDKLTRIAVILEIFAFFVSVCLFIITFK